MTLKNDYQRVAERALLACDATINSGIQEKAGFLAYHAFESTGCALAAHIGLPVGPYVGHTAKINHFQHAARQCGNARPIAALAVTVSSLRNSMLYPIEDNRTGTINVPERAITLPQAKELRARVKGVVRWVGKAI